MKHGPLGPARAIGLPAKPPRSKSAARAADTQLGRQIIRGVLGSLFGGRRR